jgi:uncharacterized protein YkwD
MGVQPISGRAAASALAIATLVVLLLVASGPSRANAAQCLGADAKPSKLHAKQAAKSMLCLINKERRSHRMRPLRSQRGQTKAARSHTRRMIRGRCFSHQCPGEPDLTRRLTRVRYLPCGCSWGIGENIAYGSGGSGSPRSVFKAWMSSSGHRANILNKGYQHIGIGVGSGTPANPSARDSATYTADFGYRR